uniref:Uncharacterized protein n=1 Tax=Rhizophora mucronata TaxID=61149 RepID=A0A2P2IVF3_RHIMU
MEVWTDSKHNLLQNDLLNSMELITRKHLPQ